MPLTIEERTLHSRQALEMLRDLGLRIEDLRAMQLVESAKATQRAEAERGPGYVPTNNDAIDTILAAEMECADDSWDLIERIAKAMIVVA